MKRVHQHPINPTQGQTIVVNPSPPFPGPQVHQHPTTHAHPSNTTVQVTHGQNVIVNSTPPVFPTPMYHPNSFFTIRTHNAPNQHYHQPQDPNTHTHVHGPKGW
ncbi:hypothetical protein EP47_14460 [Legionella norrlandica]|uniref:Uncharacterized protein n=1 Tax=Legionella norrlandica TaxID=1498499 RepID=A0A0A2SRX0_9GAMM|nr:hypothetical protein [Legionella norrlandica]KGP62466.1 hypothetical protein EP47_14460 [Legionella norrlandica]